MSTLMPDPPLSKRILPPAGLQSLLDRPDAPQLVDVRESAEFAAGRIAGSRCLPLGELERRASELDRARAVVCLCRSGKRSAQAADKLVRLGFRDVRQLEGGLMAWEQEGLPMEKDAHAPWALERQVRFAAGLLVLLGLGLAWVWPPAIALAWFVSAGLVFAALTDWCGMGLLLAKAPWNRRDPSGPAHCGS